MLSTPVVWALAAIAVWHLAHRYFRPKRTDTLKPKEERVVILGASTLDGLGAHFLRQYLERGTRRIVIVGRRATALEAVRERMLEETRDLRAPDAVVDVVAADCTQTADVLHLRDIIQTKMGGLDTLHIVFGVTSILPILGLANVDPCGVNVSGEAAHGILATSAGLEHIAGTLQHSMDGNVKGTAIVLGALIPLLQTTSTCPAVVATGSVAGLIPAPTRSIYCATKSAQHFLVNSVALECEAQAGTLVPGTKQRRSLVRFLILAPGPIKNSFVATYSVDAQTGPRDNREHALDVSDVVRETLKAVEQQNWGMLVLPRQAFAGALLSQFSFTYVSALLLTQPKYDRAYSS